MADHRKYLFACVVLVVLLCVVFIRPAAAQSRASEVDWWVISSGGGTASASGIDLSASLGQPVIGAASVGSHQLTSGFWQGISRMMFWLPLLLR
jgi:hypothetical protein